MADDADLLREHVTDLYGIRVEALLTLDQDVVLMRRSDGPNWVARWFAPSRPMEAVRGDAEILRWLEAEAYPAERCATEECVSELDGRGVLVTEAVGGVPRAQRRTTIKDAGGLARLGAMLGELSLLEPPPGGPSRPGGAWHHAADGSPAAEIEAARGWLTEAQERAPARDLAHFGTIEDELDSLDDGAGLPQAFIHPDFVFANVVATAEPRMVVVDWAGSGVGPRAWPLAFLLWAEAMRDPRRAALARAGYREVVRLSGEEVDRLAGMMRARPLIFGLWRLHEGTAGAAAVAEDALEQRRVTTALADRIRARFREEEGQSS